jgi:hypothetical protein
MKEIILLAILTTLCSGCFLLGIYTPPTYEERINFDDQKVLQTWEFRFKPLSPITTPVKKDGKWIINGPDGTIVIDTIIGTYLEQ